MKEPTIYSATVYPIQEEGLIILEHKEEFPVHYHVTRSTAITPPEPNLSKKTPDKSAPAK